MKLIALILLQFTSIQSELLSSLKNFQREEGIKQGIVTASIHRLSDNKSVLAFNEESAVNSASTLKLITSATALAKLGKDFRFQTDLRYTGKIVNGKLQGDLIIQPGADPSFGSERGPNNNERIIEDIIEAVKVMGIQHVEGNLYVNDPSIFDYDLPDSWTWADIGNYYGAIPHLFNLNENFYTIFFEPGIREGADSKISKILPFDSAWKIINKVKTGPLNSGDQVYIYGSPTSETFLLKGTVPLSEPSFAVKGSIPDPAKLFRLNILAVLEQNGVSIEEKDLEPIPSDYSKNFGNSHLLKRFYSQTLNELAKDCNHFSINLYADAFLLSQNLPEIGLMNFEESLDSLKSFWKNRGLALEGFMPKDGSGLSPTGVITTKNMTDILSDVSKSSSFQSFYASIPVLGKDGTVKFKDSKNKTDGRVRAKSGSIESTRAFAGYFSDKSGIQYSFMICVNRYEPEAIDRVRSFLDDFLVKMGSK